MNLAPIVLFVYNRPSHTLKTLEALRKNALANKSILYIFADGPKVYADESTIQKINETRACIRKKQWCKEVIIYEREINLGLADSIIKGVTEIVNKHGKIIVLEDDIVTSKGFLKYMNDALNIYELEEKVMHISGYMYPLHLKMPDTIFLNVVTPWGWGTWKSAWKYFENDATTLFNKLLQSLFFNQNDYNVGFGNEFYNQLQANVNGTLNTWAVKWHTSIFLNQGFCLHPGKSMVNNMGFDYSGTHCDSNNNYYIRNLQNMVKVSNIQMIQKAVVLKKFHEFYLTTRNPNIEKGAFHFWIRKLKKMFK